MCCMVSRLSKIVEQYALRREKVKQRSAHFLVLGGTSAGSHELNAAYVAADSFRRLTLRSATGLAQRAQPYPHLRRSQLPGCALWS